MICSGFRFIKSWNGCCSRCRGLYLDLRNRPTSREHARPQRQEREEERPEGQTGSPATEPSSTEAKLPPLDHIQPIPAPLWTQGVNGGKYGRLWPL